jgi:hypothetical protein
MGVAVPRYSTQNFFLRKGVINSWYLAVVEQFPTSLDSIWQTTFDGGCKACAGWWGAQNLCHGSALLSVPHSNYKRFHAFLVFFESDTPVITFDPEAVYTLGGTCVKTDYRVATGSTVIDSCVTCGEGNPQWFACDALPTLGAHYHGQTWNDWTLAHVDNPDKKWFRDMWNAIARPQYQIAPGVMAPIEPPGDVFEVFYGQMFDLAGDASYSGDGWCQVFYGGSEENCLASSGCTYPPYGAEMTWSVIQPNWGIQGPTELYPFALKKNGSAMGYAPGMRATIYNP